MPNHIHGIIIINRQSDNNSPSLSSVVGAFKSLSTNAWLKHINKNNLDISAKFWQRNYYEHIIRNEKELIKIREYIKFNPLNWEKDSEYNPPL